MANEETSPAIFSTDLGHIFGGDVRNELGILMCGKSRHEPTFAYDAVRIHSLMIYTEIVEYNIVGGSKAPLLRCFPFIYKLKSGDVKNTGQCMNYRLLAIFSLDDCWKTLFTAYTLICEKRLVRRFPLSRWNNSTCSHV